MTPEEEKQIRQWNATLSHDVHIRLVATEDRRSKVLQDFCHRFSTVASRVSLAVEEGGEQEPPALEVHPRLQYCAVPLGKELGPFLSALASSWDILAKALPETSLGALHTLNVPAFLRLYVAPQCPHCPSMVRQLLPLAAASAYVHVTIIDGAFFPEMSQKDGIRSVPTLLLDDDFRWTGLVPQNELLAVMADRDPSKLGANSLESLLKEGDASKVANLMISSKTIIPAFLDVLAHEKMFVRLGAMVVMEELCQREPALAKQVVDPLWDRFGGANAQIQGDILYIIGQTGSRHTIPQLEAVLNGAAASEVKEAARDALESIRSRYIGQTD